MRFDGVVPRLLAGGLATAVFAQAVVHDDARFTPDHVLRVSLAEVPSACESRQDVVVNGTSPGPALHLLPGATSWIRVYNDMEDQNLTMRMAPFADGTPGVSQWPIPPGHFFDYQIATELDDAGTYFYHSHVDMQALSCAGPLIVDDCGSSHLQYDDERIFMFQDYFQKSDEEMIEGLLSTPFIWTGETKGVLLNGKGVAVNLTAVEGPPGGSNGFFGSMRTNSLGKFNARVHADNQIQMEDDCTLPVIDVEPGKTYRFRFIGATGLSFLSMGFEGHNNLTIVQVDGNEYNVPVSTNYLQLASGQRFDVLFQTKTLNELAQSGGKTTYYLQFETRDRPELYRGYAVLRYNVDASVPAAPESPVVELPLDVTNWMEYTFQPLHPEHNQAPSAEEVTRRLILDAEQKVDERTGRLVWEIAHMKLADTAQEREKPVLVDIYQRGQAAVPNYDAAVANNGWDPATKLFPAKLNEVLEIVIQNTGSQYPEESGIVESHPFHAHGQHYYDIGSGPGKYDADANNAKLARLGYKPVKRDTTMLFRYQGQVAPGEPAGWRAWRMRMTHPGVWMVHCHILAHMIMGMQANFVVGNADQIIQIPLPLSEAYLTYGGSVYGNGQNAPSVYHYFNDTYQCNWTGGAQGQP
ncbi:uncharacterized protein THITE_48594 [Thermothielavioides terrestris NRRL 8126]|uniref:L-ascorbate oxidase n=1 Tax=Thermothielavioides terrestris (strain ATCC 38088 / NRRL 8126) TaxID=578455 RepID=G2QTL6_THETT|nr:uncharacterized protein THITE_48594 [Thermothielavioides terrestris NRRL 8126]AEO64435.1 hypothetical protein THITE_48594 [Thermothielavioides terrestris NRRL 8126]